MELLGKMVKMCTNGKNVSHVKSTEVVLTHCNTVNNDY